MGYFQESLHLRKEIGDQHGVALVSYYLGQVAYYEEDYEKAAALNREGLEIFREVGDRTHIAAALVRLGDVAIGFEEYAVAGQRFQEALAIAKERGHRWGIASSLCGLGRVARTIGDEQEARAYLSQGVHEATEMGALAVALGGLLEIGALLTGVREKEAALELLAFIVQFPAGRQHTKEGAQQRMSELTSELPSAAASAAQARGQAAKLEEVVDAILARGRGKEESKQDLLENL